MKYDVVAMGESVIDFTPVGVSDAGNILYESHPGGAPSNMLAAVAALGGKTALIGLVGNDPLGESIRNVLKKLSIDERGLRITSKAPTGITIVKLDDDGERHFFSVQTRKSYEIFSEKDLDYDLIDNARIFYIAGAMFGSTDSLKAAKTALAYIKDKKNNEIMTFCDLNWRPFLFNKSYAKNIILPILSEFDILKLSREELTLLLDTHDIEKGAAKLVECGVRLVVITLGAEGCCYCYGGGKGHVPSYNVKAKDTTAAGDAFSGALLLRIRKMGKDIEQISDSDMRDMLDFANAAGAVCASKQGAILAVPSPEEIENTRREISLRLPT